MSLSSTSEKLRSLLDASFLALIALLVAVGSGSFVSVAAGIYGKYGAGEESLRSYALQPHADIDSLDPTTRTALRQSSGFRRWWGKRPQPMRNGGDYLVALSQQPDKEWTSSWVLGTLIERERHDGYRYEHVIVPIDTSLVFAAPRISSMTRADGTKIQFDRAVLRPGVIQSLTGVPIMQVAYDPVLSEDDITFLGEATNLEPRINGFFVAMPPEGAQGAWVLHAGPSQDHAIYLVPRELSPLRDELR